MALNIDATFEGKLTCAFKNDMRNLTNFDPSTWKNLKNLHFNGLLLNKVHNLPTKKSIGEFYLMALINDATFEEKLACAFKNDMRNLMNFDLSTKNLRFNGLLLVKVHDLWAKESIGEFCLMALNIDATFEGKLTGAFKNDMRNLTNFDLSTEKSQKFAL